MKKNLKRALALVLALAMLAMTGCSSSGTTTTAAPADETTAGETTAAETTAPAATTDYTNQVIVGDTTDPTGEVAAYWSNGGSDATVNRLVFGYEVVAMNQGGEFLINPTVVKDYELTDEADGGRTLTVTLQDGLKWSNGDAITAADYVGGILLFASPLIMQMEVNATVGDYYKGFEAYNNGEAAVFEGVHLLSENSFSLTIDAEYCPNFFELANFSVSPEYMKGWLPEDITVADDGEGAYLAGDLSLDHCGDAINNWRFNMNVFCGPYVVDNWDQTNLMYTLKINPEFIGNFEGQTASIETVMVKKVDQDTMMDELRTGSVDILCQVADGNQITEGLDMVDQGLIQSVTYDRNGYGFLCFNASCGPTQFKEVRHALAYLLDRNEFAKTFTSGFGSVVNGPYGTGMWEYVDAEEQLDELLNPYSYSLDSAIAELEAGGWTLDADGNEYSGTGIRYKKLDDGSLMACELNWASSENNSVSDLIATMLMNNPDLEAAGMKINQTVMTFSELLNEHYYNPSEDYYSLYNLATNFSTPVYDMKNSFEPGHPYNLTHTNNEELYGYACSMLQVPSDDSEAFLAEWVKFVDCWNDELPVLPLYSNQYFDLFSNKIENYTDLTGYWNVGYALLYANVIGY